MSESIEFDTETFHDTYILRVVEDASVDVITMDVDFPVDWFESKYERRRLVFRDAFNYQVHEQDFSGSPQILRMSRGHFLIRYSIPNRYECRVP